MPARHALHSTATAMPFDERTSASRAQGSARTIMVDGCRISIVPQRAAGSAGCHAQTPEQCGRVAQPGIRKCRRDAQREALEALRTLSEPFSIDGAAAELEWPRGEIRYWTNKFTAKRWLDADRGGHRWTAAGRNEP